MSFRQPCFVQINYVSLWLLLSDLLDRQILLPPADNISTFIKNSFPASFSVPKSNFNKNLTQIFTTIWEVQLTFHGSMDFLECRRFICFIKIMHNSTYCIEIKSVDFWKWIWGVSFLWRYDLIALVKFAHNPPYTSHRCSKCFSRLFI